MRVGMDNFNYLSEGLCSPLRESNSRDKISNLGQYDVNLSNICIALNISLKDVIFICKIIKMNA